MTLLGFINEDKENKEVDADNENAIAAVKSEK